MRGCASVPVTPIRGGDTLGGPTRRLSHPEVSACFGMLPEALFSVSSSPCRCSSSYQPHLLHLHFWVDAAGTLRATHTWPFHPCDLDRHKLHFIVDRGSLSLYTRRTSDVPCHHRAGQDRRSCFRVHRPRSFCTAAVALPCLHTKWSNPRPRRDSAAPQYGRLHGHDSLPRA